MQRQRTQNEVDFIKIVKRHPQLQALVQVLPKLGLTVEAFLDAIKLEKFLTSQLGIKGNVFEVLVLNDRVMVNLLYQRALGTLKNLALQVTPEIFERLPQGGLGAAVTLPARTAAELQKLVLNIKNAPYDPKDFGLSDVSLGRSGEGLHGDGKRIVGKPGAGQHGIGKLYGLRANDSLAVRSAAPKGGSQLALATNFNTVHKNLQGEEYPLLFMDFSMVYYNPTKNRILILVPGEIKEPAAARELADQLSKIEGRLKGCEGIEFDLPGRTDRMRVKPEDVFVVRDNSLGLPRKNAAPTREPPSGRNVRFSGDVLEVVQVNSSETRSAVDPQDFFRFSVKVQDAYNPDAIAKVLFEIKTQNLNLPP